MLSFKRFKHLIASRHNTRIYKRYKYFETTRDRKEIEMDRMKWIDKDD